MRRRYLLAGTAAFPADPIRAVTFRDEAAMLGVLARRVIPANSLSLGGRDLGCVAFIDRQLAEPFSRAEGLNMRPPLTMATTCCALDAIRTHHLRHPGLLASA